MIELREKYEGDHIRQYYPKCDSQNFSNFTDKKNKYHLILSIEEKYQKDRMFMQIALRLNLIMAASLTFIGMYDKIPLINKIQNSFMKGIIWSGAFLIPTILYSYYSCQQKIENIQMRIFQNYKSQYFRYLQNGDIREFCPEVRLADC